MDDGESLENGVVGVISDIVFSSVLSFPECSADVLATSILDVDGMDAFLEQAKSGGGGGGGGSCASKRFSSMPASESDEQNLLAIKTYYGFVNKHEQKTHP